MKIQFNAQTRRYTIYLNIRSEKPFNVSNCDMPLGSSRYSLRKSSEINMIQKIIIQYESTIDIKAIRFQNCVMYFLRPLKICCI